MSLFSRFFEWYFGFPPLWRFLISLVPLGFAVVPFFISGRIYLIPGVLGVILLLCSFPSDREKNKWGDW